jgi:3-methyladenine DNA glycosylase AlkD
MNEYPIKKILADLENLGDRNNTAGMQQFGIQAENALGVRIPELRKYAAKLGKNHTLALILWENPVHEAKLLATLIDEYPKVTAEQMEAWAYDFYSWDICDGACNNLFDKTPYAWNKAREWTKRSEEFVKRAGFVLMATLSVHDKKASDEPFMAFLPYIEQEAYDDRNFVKKAVNWALRSIGKRNKTLNAEAIQCAQRIYQQKTKSARWIASDALRELQSKTVRKKLNRS